MKWRFAQIIGVLIFGLQFTACKKEGCTNAAAANYDADANVSDGSCVFGGCTDEAALNYDADAVGDDGTCQYISDINFVLKRNLEEGQYVHVYWEKQYKGVLQTTCTDSDVSCTTECEQIELRNIEPDRYYFGLVLRPGTDTLKSGLIQVGSERCMIIAAE